MVAEAQNDRSFRTNSQFGRSISDRICAIWIEIICYDEVLALSLKNIPTIVGSWHFGVDFSNFSKLSGFAVLHEPKQTELRRKGYVGALLGF